MADAAPNWYDKGLRFECTQCGNCCTGPPGVVHFSAEEATAMAKRLDVDEAAFYKHYTRIVFGDLSLTERETEHGFDCVFLDRDTEPGKALCQVYGARPAQCRTWPFWPENLRSERAWENAKGNTPCPGMNQGKLVPVEEIRIRVKATPKG